MGLQTYQHKRNFRETSEPRGKRKSSSNELLFVIQKHNASRLHYDFRLELDGVLLSWAVPKGPSLNPAERHLAVKVEDHPYDYKDFEGIIAPGNYGAGEVIVWDNGTYHWENATSKKESEIAMRKGLDKGHLQIVLQGSKLKGLFHLVRLKNSEWLLIKSNDEFARKADILKNDASVITGKTLKDYAPKKSVKKSLKKTARKTAGKKTSTPKKTVAKKSAVKKRAAGKSKTKLALKKKTRS